MSHAEALCEDEDFDYLFSSSNEWWWWDTATPGADARGTDTVDDEPATPRAARLADGSRQTALERSDTRPRLSDIGTAETSLGYRRPWYRTTKGLSATIALAVVAVVVSSVLLLLQGPDTGAGESTAVESPPADTAPPPGGVTASTPSPPAPPVPPPPPPPPPPNDLAPGYQGRAPGYGPSQQDRPEIGVTRAPATRAPISVAPSQRTPADANYTPAREGSGGPY